MDSHIRDELSSQIEKSAANIVGVYTERSRSTGTLTGSKEQCGHARCLTKVRFPNSRN